MLRVLSKTYLFFSYSNALRYKITRLYLCIKLCYVSIVARNTTQNNLFYYTLVLKIVCQVPLLLVFCQVICFSFVCKCFLYCISIFFIFFLGCLIRKLLNYEMVRKSICEFYSSISYVFNWKLERRET